MTDMRVVAIVLMLSVGACDHADEPSAVVIPEAFQGRWSTDSETCDRKTLATRDWLFVYEDVIGGFEHLYPIATLELVDNVVKFTTERGGPHGSLTLLDDGALLWSSNAKQSEFRLCSRDPEL